MLQPFVVFQGEKYRETIDIYIYMVCLVLSTLLTTRVLLDNWNISAIGLLCVFFKLNNDDWISSLKHCLAKQNTWMTRSPMKSHKVTCLSIHVLIELCEIRFEENIHILCVNRGAFYIDLRALL